MTDIDDVDPTGQPRARLAGVDLNLLVAFDALMAEGSVSRAATRMSVGQSAMSATLGRLRRLLDDPLLVRQGRHLVPTPLAVSLVDPVHDVLSSIERTLARTRPAFDPDTDHHVFTIATSDYVALVFLRPFLAELARRAPHLRLHVQPVTGDVRDRLRRGAVDLLILPTDVLGAEHGFRHAPLFDDRYVCVLDRDHPEVGDTLTVEDFRRQPHLAHTVGALSSLAERQLDARGIVRTVEVSVESLLLAPSLVRGTRLLTLVPERLARAVAAPLGLRVLETPMPLDPLEEVMAWTPRHEDDPAHRWLRGRLLDLAARP